MFFRFIPIWHQCLVAFSDVFILFAFKATIREDSSLFNFIGQKQKFSSTRELMIGYAPSKSR